MSLTFGDFIKKKRLAIGKDLIGFCLENGINWSRYQLIEEGIVGPPTNMDSLRVFADWLNIKKDSKDLGTLYKLACKYWKKGATKE